MSYMSQKINGKINLWHFWNCLTCRECIGHSELTKWPHLYTGYFEMIVGGLTTRHKLEISVCSCTDESRGLCSSSSRKYHGTEGTNQNGHWNHHRWHATDSLDKQNQLDVTVCILHFSSNSWSTCFGQPCAHHQELTTAWCYSLVLVCPLAAERLSRPVGR